MWKTKHRKMLTFFVWNFLTIYLGTTPSDQPKVLYRVKAAYKYVKEDADELSFDVDEIIDVIEYDDPEDQVHYSHFLSLYQSLKSLLFVFLHSFLGGRMAYGSKRKLTGERSIPCQFYASFIIIYYFFLSNI